MATFRHYFYLSVFVDKVQTEVQYNYRCILSHKNYQCCLIIGCIIMLQGYLSHRVPQWDKKYD